MIAATLPTLQQQLIDGRIQSTEGQIKIYVDESIFSEQRWEQNFPQQAEKEDLQSYCSRVVKIAEKDCNLAVVTSMLKGLYCYIETELNFKQFLQLFSMNDLDYLERLITTIVDVFNSIFGGSVEKN